MTLEKLDHFVLPVSDIDTISAFYTTYLGMEKRIFGEGRVALHFGDQKINLHPAGWDYEPKARVSVAGTADLCFIVSEPVATVQTKFVNWGIEIIEGPVMRTGATGCLCSIYIRDPDGNLIELSNRVD
ncbi:MAG TPA: VOC family protein [Gammaproteobacteria bacterium]|jgi:catechol 2,3-dioxygenase-like lactoylglutathione lyase family enzyme|nr:VOC family protein [Pseudomonadales bacterium]HIA41020.1 VOC family protein [Gammaproteobacteria bacterium]HIO03055.1 VOC family protein [Alphaproteobacteria bacterium]